MAARANLATLVKDFEVADSEVATVAERGLRHVRHSYRELAFLARRFAAELQRRKVRRADRVILWGENSGEWIAAFFGCVLEGVLPVPLDSAGSSAFFHRVQEEVQPKLVVVDRPRLSMLSNGGPSNDPPALIFERLNTTLTEHASPGLSDLSSSDPLQIIFTSGTTAEPKGVVHTHGNVLASLGPIEAEIARYRRWERFFHPIRILHTLPLSHVFGQFMGLWLPPILRTEVHYETRPVASELIGTLRRRRISVLATVPRILDLLEAELLRTVPNLADRLRSGSALPVAKRWWHFADVHRLLGFKFWAVVCGGAALPARSEGFWSTLGFAVVQGYGMTETTALVSLNHPFKLARGTVGKVLPGREVRIGEDGEVLVRGDTIARSSWSGGQVVETDSEWLATGDLAELDGSGNLRYRGRKKDVIVSAAGLNIHPEDLEAALQAAGGLRGAAIVEVGSSNGPEPVAVLLPDGSRTPEDIVAEANRHLQPFQQIQRWSVWSGADLPRTSTGKVLRREIARQIGEDQLGGAESQIMAAGEGQALDSLGRLQMQAEAESRYGVVLSDEAVQQLQTKADLQRIVRVHQAQTPGTIPGHRAPEHAYPRWPWRRPVKWLRFVFLEAVAMPLLRFLAKPALRLRVPLPRRAGPMLIVANHVTAYDAPFVLYALPGYMRRRTAIAMSGEWIMDWRRRRNQGHWFLNLIGPLTYLVVTALFNVFPLPQQSGFRRSFRHAGEAIDRGYNVLVFPEGRRSDDGSRQSFMAGAGVLWRDLDVPALAVHIDGLGKLKQRGYGWFRSGEMTVHRLKLLPAPDRVDPEELTTRLSEAVFPDDLAPKG